MRCGKILQSRTGSLHAGYLKLQIHTFRMCNTYCFSTATVVARTRLSVGVIRTFPVLSLLLFSSIKAVISDEATDWCPSSRDAMLCRYKTCLLDRVRTDSGALPAIYANRTGGCLALPPRYSGQGVKLTILFFLSRLRIIAITVKECTNPLRLNFALRRLTFVNS